MKKILPVAKKYFKSLGTTIEVWIVVVSEPENIRAQQDLSEVLEYYTQLEKIFSRFEPESELSVLNGDLGKFLPASEEMRTVAKHALGHYLKTDSYFDPRIIGQLENIGYSRDFKNISSTSVSSDMSVFSSNDALSEDLIIQGGKACFNARMDFSGIVKGYATDQVAQFLFKRGWKNFMVNSGGDIFFAGHDDEKNVWPVDIEGVPYEKLLLQLEGVGVATSGIGKRKWEKEGKRFHHIINPKKPHEFSFDLSSVTVVAPFTEEADVWAKTLFLMGKDFAKEKAIAKDIPCVILEYGMGAWISPSLKKYIYKK